MSSVNIFAKKKREILERTDIGEAVKKAGTPPLPLKDIKQKKKNKQKPSKKSPSKN